MRRRRPLHPSLESSIKACSTPHSLKPRPMRWYRSEPADVLKAALPAGTNVGTIKAQCTTGPIPLEFFYLEDSTTKPRCGVIAR